MFYIKSLIIFIYLFLGFIVRESKEVIYRAREAVGNMCYSGDMFDNWTYFGPVEMIEKDQYNKVCQCITGIVILLACLLHRTFLHIKSN